ncbi:MAG: alanine racemase [Candidatus Doudnabacteria bacterium CG10_big_fil_rev_8_21_14_0_10_42_18]|uniref:Alanine racemase n=1 Tax=Candidatus Doudnabacteria bacterium CG10_big_fil_rev_8_21_14_0_10_42_18 TaxID=1974552 RepID=A0A2H0VA66_9BACT|nr:MAG: alanine racemase [Candidatus Doudnabacteria bacterium CG10_big_fil_rev_8_21_14_0_10_42_18]
MFFSRLLNFLFKPRIRYNPLIEVFVFKDVILKNLRSFQAAYPNLQMAPVLKSNAYGHGLFEVASILEDEKAPFIIVDSFFEALTLRQKGIKQKILVIGYTTPEQILSKKLQNVSYTIIGIDQLKQTALKLETPVNFHLKIDTGMHRQGVLEEEVSRSIQIIKQNKNFVLEGVCTHFAIAHKEGERFTRTQIEQWRKIVQTFKKNFSNVKYFHAAATGGLMFASETEANVARLGVGLYGHDPNNLVKLEPTLEVRSVISSVKSIKKGEAVGYETSFMAEKDMKIATVPMGYFEGEDIRLSGKGFLKVKDKFCPIVGRVSMNITTIDVSILEDVKVGDSVVVISKKREDRNSIENINKICGTIPREVWVKIPAHLRRRII